MDINIYISKFYIDFFNKQVNDNKINKKIFDNKIVNINFITNFNSNDVYDIIIKMKNNFK
jgi:hypothetical protein